jgi:dTDP-4-amino-4,6-dideoxygalactose transaminase
MASMKAQGIQTSIHYPPIHQFQAYRLQNYPHRNLSITESVSAREVTLPLYATLRQEDVQVVAQAAASALRDLSLK